MTIDTLQVMWIDADRRERHRVGSLRRDGGTFRFAYDDLTTAIEHGFAHLPEFPASSREYASDRLFATFADRLPDPRRSDRGRMVAELGLEEPADDFDLLARSGGTLATDRIELAEHREVGDRFERPLTFQVRGTQYNPTPADQPLVPGEVLTVQCDPRNEYDEYACELHRGDGLRVGFVPKSYAEVVAAAVHAGLPLRVVLLHSILLPRQQPPTGSEPTWIAEIRAV